MVNVPDGARRPDGVRGGYQMDSAGPARGMEQLSSHQNGAAQNDAGQLPDRAHALKKPHSIVLHTFTSVGP